MNWLKDRVKEMSSLVRRKAVIGTRRNDYIRRSVCQYLGMGKTFGVSYP